MKIPLFTKIILLLIFINTFSGCVSKKQYQLLENKVNQLENRSTIDLTDSDGDGIIDLMDQQKNTLAGCPVDTRGVILDSDNDGVADCKDKEPYTPSGYVGTVDADGVSNIPTPDYITEGDVNRIVDAKMAGIKTTTATAIGSELDKLTFPEFNIPAPHFSKIESYLIQEKFNFAETYGDVDNEFKTILKKSGFINDSNQTLFSYYQVKQDGKFKGYALVTAFEKIDKTGKPLPDRFNLTVNKKARKSFLDYIFPTSLNKGYFRCFAFLVTDEYFGSKGKSMSRNEMAKALQNKATTLHPLMAEQFISGRCEFHVLVYEFEQLESEKDGSPSTLGQLPVKNHLEGAGIWKYLKSN